MSIEKNIIFIYPILPVLNELKTQLETDDSFTVYEMDSTNEYKQLIGVLETSITFSSDMKKTSHFLQENTNFLSGANTKCFAITNKTIPPFVIGKLQKFGLTEILKDDTQLKSLMHKVENFYLQLESKEQAEKEAKEKSYAGVLIMNKKSSESISTEEKQRVEKLISSENPKEEFNPQRKKVNLSGIEIHGGELRSKLGYSSGSFASPFDNIQRKRVSEFTTKNSEFNLKKSSFKLPDIELKKKRNNFVDQTVDPKLKNLKTFEDKTHVNKKKNSSFLDAELEKKKSKSFEDNTALNKKRGIFKEVDIEKKKHNAFQDMTNPLKRRRLDFKEIDRDKKKRKAFVPVLNRLNQKHVKFVPVERELKKRNLPNFDLPQKTKKNNKFEEVSNEREISGAKKDPEGQGLKKKENIHFDELNKNKNKTKIDELDLNKKKGLGFKEVEQEHKKSKKFVKVEIEKKSNKNFVDLEIKRDDINKNREDVLLERKKRNISFEQDIDKRKDLKDLVIVTKKELQSEKEVNKNKSKTNQLEKLLKLDKKDWGEQTLDYRTMKIQMQEKKANLRSEEQVLLDKRLADQLALLDEVQYFYPGTYGLEYLVHSNALLFNKDIDNLKTLKFIHFSLIKEMSSDTTFFLLDSSKVNESGDFKVSMLYHGHKVNTVGTGLYKDEEDFSYDQIQKWVKTDLPTWEDETYQNEINQFIYPYYEDGKKYGFAIAHFKNSVTGHFSALKAELLLMSAKNIILAESTL